MLLKIAWRNVWRNKSRSLIVVSSIAVGVWALVAGTGFMNGFMVSYISDAINHNLSNIQVHNPEFSTDKDIQYFIANSKEKTELLRKIAENNEKRIATNRKLTKKGRISKYDSFNLPWNYNI